MKVGWRKKIAWTVLLAASALSGMPCAGQELTSFEVSNVKNLKWSPEEAGRIYKQACQVVAQSLRPQRPPVLRPRFLLVLGAKQNQVVRMDDRSEIRLKKWDPEGFAEGIVILSAREILKTQEVLQLAHATLLAAASIVSVTQLKPGR